MRNYCTLIFILMIVNLTAAETLHVPASYSTIQQAINAAADGDTVLVAPGTYQESLEIDDKTIVLGSLFIISKNQSDVLGTIIDGAGADYVLRIRRSDKQPASIIGLTIQNGDDGILPNSKFNILNCRIINCVDGIDYESGSGGICRGNTFENNDDDGIDLDADVDILIEKNYIINNDDDGIEIRLHDYTGPLLNYVIKNNIISGNDEDGIQIIDYPGYSDRVLRISNNLILDNAMAGIGCMSDGKTEENYEGAAIVEPIFIINNTLSGNEYGITGGANLLAKNNIIVNCAETAYKNLSGASLISYSCLWNNGQDFDNSNIDGQTNKVNDPVFVNRQDYLLASNSQCIDAGDPHKDYNDPPDQNDNMSAQWPAQGQLRNDLGAYGGPFAADWPETLITKIKDSRSGYLTPGRIRLKQNYPNPFNPETKIEYQLLFSGMVEVLVFDSSGRQVRTLDFGFKAPGHYAVTFDGNDLASGMYYYNLKTDRGSSFTKKMLLLR